MKNRTSATLLSIVLSASATVAVERDAAHESILPGHGECPELFEIPVGGDKHNTRWIAYGGTGDYDIGTFDGHQFSKESGTHIYAFANLKSCGFFDASQTWSIAPDERRIQIATCWTSAGVPADMPFTQGMFFPVTLNLRSTPDGLRMCPWPIADSEGSDDGRDFRRRPSGLHANFRPV